jgi:hypothetical protein
MEADWEFEMDGDAAVIDAAWAGFVDLRLAPERVRELAEVAAFPALGLALQRLNGPTSSVWTAKCDFWPTLEPGTWDPDEMDAAPEEACYGTGCYIDLLPRSNQQWTFPGQIERDCRALCARLQTIPLRACRVDLIVRRAWITPNLASTGITAYGTACGPTEASATERLAACLSAFTAAILVEKDAIPPKDNSTIQ